MTREEWEDRLCSERRENLRNQLIADAQRLNRLEKNLSKLSELSVQMGEIIQYHREQLDRQEQRIAELERSPKRYAELIKNTAVSAVVSGVMAYVISVLLK